MLHHPVPIGTTANGQYCTLLQNKVRPAFHHKQPELLEHGVILLQDNAASHRHHNAHSLLQHWGWQVLARSPYTQYLAPSDYWLFSHVKEHLWDEQFESEDHINSAVTPSLHRLSKDEYRGAVDRLPRGWGKCVDSAGDYPEWKIYV